MLTNEEKIADLRDTLKMAQDQFLFYVDQHLAKSPPDEVKAKVNRDYATRCGQTLIRAA